MTSSVAAPAWTMMMATRGVRREATKSFRSAAGTKSPSEPCRSMSLSVWASVRLKTATA